MKLIHIYFNLPHSRYIKMYSSSRSDAKLVDFFLLLLLLSEFEFCSKFGRPKQINY